MRIKRCRFQHVEKLNYGKNEKQLKHSLRAAELNNVIVLYKIMSRRRFQLDIHNWKIRPSFTIVCIDMVVRVLNLTHLCACLFNDVMRANRTKTKTPHYMNRTILSDECSFSILRNLN